MKLIPGKLYKMRPEYSKLTSIQFVNPINNDMFIVDFNKSPIKPGDKIMLHIGFKPVKFSDYATIELNVFLLKNDFITINSNESAFDLV